MAQRFTELGLPCRGTLGSKPFRGAQGCLARSFGGEATSSLHGRSLQRRRRHPQRGHAAPPPPDGQPDALPPATRPGPSQSGWEGRMHRARFRRHAPLGVPVRPTPARATRRFRADIERQVRDDFPFLPAGCSFDLDPVAREIVLRSIREAIPSTWRERCQELRSLGDVSLGEYLESSGLEPEDVYAGGHSWTEMRREVGLATAPADRGGSAAAGRRADAARRRRRTTRGLPTTSRAETIRQRSKA